MHVVHYPPVPCAIPIHEQLRDGCEIDIHGEVRHGHHKDFAVELLSGPHIVLHINFRFHHEHTVVMNSCSYGSWGPEARHHNSLHSHEHFHLHIYVRQCHYDIEVNGHHLASFNHRFPAESVQAIGLKGDVYIEKVNFRGFHFHRDWNGTPDYGHSGYGGYGTTAYMPPAFSPGHHFNAYW
uniref:Galectin n=1 Tax=Angiostrongylus cantonensis TaxID=6313 RepID=F1KBP7_ANGCA|nr:galectin protein 10 [Angiostrongylus cantonensis]